MPWLQQGTRAIGREPTGYALPGYSALRVTPEPAESADEFGLRPPSDVTDYGSPEAALARLGQWAEQRRTANPVRLQDAKLAFSGVDVCVRTTRLVESREKRSHQDAQGPGDMVQITAPSAPLPVPSPLVAGQFDLLVEGSHSVAQCSTCHGRGDSECRDCGGRVMVKCPRCGGDGQRRCSDCSGTGQHRCDKHETEKCNSCRGSGKAESNIMTFDVPCRECNAKGRFPCHHCCGVFDRNDVACQVCRTSGIVACTCAGGMITCESCVGGRVACGPCEASGRMHSWITLQVERTVQISDQVHWPVPDVERPRAITVHVAPTILDVDRTSHVGGFDLPTAWIREQVAISEQLGTSEIASSVELRVLPFAAIDWDRCRANGPRRAWIVGTDMAVTAPGLAGAGALVAQHPALVIVAAVALVTVIVTLIFVL